MDAFTVQSPIHDCRSKHGAARCWVTSRRWLLGLSLAIVCQAAFAQAMYRIKPLGWLPGCQSSTPEPMALNDADEVTGAACVSPSTDHAFLWRNNGAPMVDLDPSEPDVESWGTALNSAGLVTGCGFRASGNRFAFVSPGDGASFRKIDGGSKITDLCANAINDLGQLTGSAVWTGTSAEHAFFYRNDGTPPIDLGTLGTNYLGASGSYGTAINASGQVAGTSTAVIGRMHAFVWKNDGKEMIDLGPFDGADSFAVAINASGQVAGEITKASSDFRHAFFWRGDGTPMLDLRTLSRGKSDVRGFNDSGWVTGNSWNPHDAQGSGAYIWMNDGMPMKNLDVLGGVPIASAGMNAAGQVTGALLLADHTEHAALWRNDGTKTQDLNDLIDPTDPLKPYVTLTRGLFINSRGDVLAEGTDSQSPSFYFLLQGTVITLKPRSLGFGNQPINTTSAAKSVTVTNTSPKAVAITSIALSGSAPWQFAITDNCGKSLAGHATCTINETFRPITKGAKSAFLKVNGGGGGLRSVTLTGSGT